VISLGTSESITAAINFTKLDFFNGNTFDDWLRRFGSANETFFEQQGYETDDATLLKIAPIVQEHIAVWMKRRIWQDLF
jgi:hypothetical protein